MARPLTHADLAVVGGGPAGRAVATRGVTAGLSVALIDPQPEREWTATYGAWADELPDWVPATVMAATISDARAFARTEHVLERSYVMLSTPALQRTLSAAGGVDVVADAVVGLRRDGNDTAVLLRSGEPVRARVVVDASGARRVLGGRPCAGIQAAQTAVGVVVSDGGDLPRYFMDWRNDHGHDGWPTFLYAVPLSDQRVLLEETSLARRPALPLRVLQQRLHDRLAARGIAIPDDAPTEQVGFVVDTPLTRGSGPVVTFGAAAPLIHPATGYSLAAALRLADPLVHAIADGLPDAMAAAEAGRQVVWPRQARLIHHLRRRGLEAMLALPPQGVIDFFELFFSLPPGHQRAYLSDRDDARAVTAAMVAVFLAADGPLRRHLIRWGGMPFGRHVGPSGA